mgnify:CR=1 FL=1
MSDSSVVYHYAADAVLLLHGLFVVFVVGGLIVIFIGAGCAWAWVRNPYFRYAHAAAIGIVTLQAWVGIVCPLTTLEMFLRSKAGEVVYAGTFMAHWVGQLLYYDAPASVFIVAYSVFALVVVASWIVVRPRRFKRQTND